MSRGHSLSIYARFSGKKRTSLCTSLKEKFARKAGVNTGRGYRIVLMCPGHPIILLKSNKFNIADVWAKRPIKSKYLRTQNSVLVLKRPSFSFPFKSFLLVVIK